MVSSLDIHLHWMRSSCTTLATNNTTNLTATASTPIVSQVQSTATSNMTMVWSAPLFATTISQWRRSTLPRLGWNASTLPQRCCWWVLSWIFLSQMIFNWMVHLLILFFLTTALTCLSLSQRWPPLSQSHPLISLLPILKIPFYLHSFVSTLRSPMSTMGNITKVTLALFIFKSHINKRKEDWGVSLPNLPTTWVAMCVEFSSLDMSHIPFFGPLLLLSNQHLILLPCSQRCEPPLRMPSYIALSSCWFSSRLHSLATKLLWKEATNQKSQGI